MCQQPSIISWSFVEVRVERIVADARAGGGARKLSVDE
jgi:hypothetical protein